MYILQEYINYNCNNIIEDEITTEFLINNTIREIKVKENWNRIKKEIISVAKNKADEILLINRENGRDDPDVQKVDELIIYLRNLVSNCSSKLKKEIIEIGIELENLSEITEKIKENERIENKIKNPPGRPRKKNNISKSQIKIDEFLK